MTDVGPCVLAPTRKVTSLKATLLASVFAPALTGAMSLATISPALAVCQGPGTQTSQGGTPQTQCVTAITIPGSPLQSFDISFVNAPRSEYYLADRANKGVDILGTNPPAFKTRVPGFVGIVFNTAGAIDNNHSGPDGVTSFGHWLYAGDGDSTLKVIDLNNTGAGIQQSISTGGHTRVDEMDITTDGNLLLAANNAEDPPFATLFRANGNSPSSNVSILLGNIQIDPSIVPAGHGLSMEQPAWEQITARFYVSVPIIANNPAGCSVDTPTCGGGLLVIDPAHPQSVYGAFNSTTNTGVIPLQGCNPNGATVGPNSNILLGCTPGNNPSNTITQVINAITKNTVNVQNITGSDEVWFNAGDQRYYLGASKSYTSTNAPCTAIQPPAPGSPKFCAVLGVVDATNVLIETIPQSSNSHSVAADYNFNFIFVPQVCKATTAPVTCAVGGDSTTVGQQLCGGTSGCIAVYHHSGGGGKRPPPPAD
jgi:hypothetical protein